MTSSDDDATAVASERDAASTGFVPPVETCTVDERTVAYATYGDPDGVPVVAFHGLPGSRAFGALLAGTAREHDVRLLVPDRPGVGGSDSAGYRSVAATADWFTGFLDALDVDAAGVLGFSAGGPHALACRALAPDRTHGAALLASPAPPTADVPEPLPTRALGALARHSQLGLSLACRVQAALLARADADALVDLFTTAAVADDPVAIDSGTDQSGVTVGDVLVADARLTLANDHRALATEYRALNADWELDPHVVGASVQIYHGRDDENVDPAAADHYARVLPDATVHRPAVDHLELLLRHGSDALATAVGR